MSLLTPGQVRNVGRHVTLRPTTHLNLFSFTFWRNTMAGNWRREHRKLSNEREWRCEINNRTLVQRDGTRCRATVSIQTGQHGCSVGVTLAL